MLKVKQGGLLLRGTCIFINMRGVSANEKTASEAVFKSRWYCVVGSLFPPCLCPHCLCLENLQVQRQRGSGADAAALRGSIPPPVAPVSPQEQDANEDRRIGITSIRICPTSGHMIVWDATAKNYNQQGQGHSLITYPAMHHIRVQALRQGHTANACLRLGTEGEYLCLELLAVFTPGVEQNDSVLQTLKSRLRGTLHQVAAHSEHCEMATLAHSLPPEGQRKHRLRPPRIPGQTSL